MSKKSSYIAAILAILCVGAYIHFDNQESNFESTATASNELIEKVSDEPMLTSSEKLSADHQRNLNNDPLNEQAERKYLEYQQLFELREELQSFFDDAKNGMPENIEESRVEFENKLNELSNLNRLSQSERLMLQLAFIKLNPDLEAAKRESQKLIEDYKKISDARQKSFEENPSAKFKKYKSREKEIVSEILKMETFPDGLTRDQYLAKRLAEARADAYQKNISE